MLHNLADLKLIFLTKTSDDPFLTVVRRIRKKAAEVPPTLEETTKRIVRSNRYTNEN